MLHNGHDVDDVNYESQTHTRYQQQLKNSFSASAGSQPPIHPGFQSRHSKPHAWGAGMKAISQESFVRTRVIHATTVCTTES